MAARKKKKKVATPAGRDTYHVMVGDVELATRSEGAHALNIATRFAEKGSSGLTVLRRSLFGPSTTLYRVDSDEHGTVFTTTLNPED